MGDGILTGQSGYKKSTGTAVESEVIAGKTFSNASGIDKVGTGATPVKSITINTNHTNFRWGGSVTSVTLAVGAAMPQLIFNDGSTSNYCNPSASYNY